MNNQHLNLVCHGMPWSSQGIPSSSIPTITTVKVTHFGSNNQLVERHCPPICSLHIQSNHHIIRNEEASCEGMHSEQRECQVSASSNNQLVERHCPPICSLHIQSNHHIIRNEEASCEGMHSEQRECQVSAKAHNSRQNKTSWGHSHQHSAQGGKCRSSQLNAKIDS